MTKDTLYVEKVQKIIWFICSLTDGSIYCFQKTNFIMREQKKFKQKAFFLKNNLYI